MKKILVASIVAGSLFAASNVFAADGKALFTQKGCTTCHNPTKDQLAMGLGPSLKMVSAAYKGNAGDVVKFLEGKAQPKVAPDKFPTMQGQLAMLSGTPEGELKAIAEFILKH